MRSTLVVALLIACSVGVFAASQDAMPWAPSASPSQMTVGQDGTLSVRWNEGLSISNGVCGAMVNGVWVSSPAYPTRQAEAIAGNGPLGQANGQQVTFSGLQGQPDLIWRVKRPADGKLVVLELGVRNSTDRAVKLSSFRLIRTEPGELVLGNATRYRVLSETLMSTNKSTKTLFLDDKRKAIDSTWLQLTQNPDNGHALLAACMSVNLFVTRITMSLTNGKLGIEVTNSGSGIEDAPKLDLDVAPGETVYSDAVVLMAEPNYDALLHSYAEAFHRINKIPESKPAPMVYCSWTAHYWALNEGLTMSNARVLASQFKQLGYSIYQLDGAAWQYARGDYHVANGRSFPHGIGWLGERLTDMGLRLGLWIGPFQVNDRSSIYLEHPDWLVKDASGKPMPYGPDRKSGEGLVYCLDATNPEVQQWLRRLYSTLYYDYQCRYFKLDFLNFGAVEGIRYKRNSTGLENVRTGLKIIRESVGPDAYFVSAVTPLYAVSGILDAARCGNDIAHDFEKIRFEADNVACRHYLHNKLFTLDPDAMLASNQLRPSRVGGSQPQAIGPITLEEARVCVTAAALTGGILQLGDDLPNILRTPDRIALLKNTDLIAINRLGKTAEPVDLMDFEREGDVPRYWHVGENRTSDVLAVFNWEEEARPAAIELSRLGLDPKKRYELVNIWNPKSNASAVTGRLTLPMQPAHSVRLFKLLDRSAANSAPVAKASFERNQKIGETYTFDAGESSDPDGDGLSFAWDMGDGNELIGRSVDYAYTYSGKFTVTLTVMDSLGARTAAKLPVTVTGELPYREPITFEKGPGRLR